MRRTQARAVQSWAWPGSMRAEELALAGEEVRRDPGAGGGGYLNAEGLADGGTPPPGPLPETERGSSGVLIRGGVPLFVEPAALAEGGGEGDESAGRDGEHGAD